MMLSFRKLATLVVSFLMTFSNIACTTMKPIGLITEPNQIATQIKAGDEIQYRTDSGKIEKLKVTSVNGEMIQGTRQGQDIKVMIIDIKNIEKREFNPGKTTGLVLGIIAGVILVLVVAIANSNPWEFTFGPN